MKPTLFKLGAAPKIEARLRKSVLARLKERRKRDADYPELWKKEAAVRPEGMTLGQSLRFILWYRQFEVHPIPGLGRAVGTARLLVKRVTKLKQWVRA